MRVAWSLLALALAVPPAGARVIARCDARHASDCARRELGAQAAALPALLRTVFGLVPLDSAAKAGGAGTSVEDGCRTITTDPTGGTFAIDLHGCPAAGATVDGRVTGVAGVQAVGSITGESGCAPMLSGAPLGATCPVDTQISAVADVALTLTDTNGAAVEVACASGPGTGLDVLVSIDVVLTKVTAGTPGATCFPIPGFCVTFTAAPKGAALTGTCASRTPPSKRSIPVALTGLQFPVVDPADVGCALVGQAVVAPSRRLRIAATFDGDCVPALELFRRRRHHPLSTPAALF
jgi:hypothetical protein